MNNTDFQVFKQLDQLADRSRKHLFSFSPNDALVQISLPLVLILAIATRLMILSQSVAEENQSPALLDLWKQQLILRIDKVLEDWERSSRYNAFPEYSRVQWQEDWPADKAFAHLCRDAKDLQEPDALALQLYYDALSYQPRESDPSAEGAPAAFSPLYDPQAPDPPANAADIPEEFHITPERREFALQYIRKRCLVWKKHVSELQWALVASCAQRQPVSESWSDRELAAQMRKLARTLEKRGYPLLPTVTREYSSDGAATP